MNAPTNGTTGARRFSRITRSSRTRRKPVHRCIPRSSQPGDRKSTRLNSSHMSISYAVFCLKKKKANGESHRMPPIKVDGTTEIAFEVLRTIRVENPDLDLGTCADRDVIDWLNLFFFNDTATTEIYTLSLHDALPI